MNSISSHWTLRRSIYKSLSNDITDTSWKSLIAGFSTAFITSHHMPGLERLKYYRNPWILKFNIHLSTHMSSFSSRINCTHWDQSRNRKVKRKDGRGQGRVTHGGVQVVFTARTLKDCGLKYLESP